MVKDMQGFLDETSTPSDAASMNLQAPEPLVAVKFKKNKKKKLVK